MDFKLNLTEQEKKMLDTFNLWIKKMDMYLNQEELKEDMEKQNVSLTNIEINNTDKDK